jgi:gluconate 2-dehydrogenase gamma chain
MIPSGIPEGSPGARETRALLHLDRALASKAYRGYARLIRDGLDRLDHEARRRHDAPFPALPPAQQDALLAEWQRRPRRPRAYPSAHFFALVFAFGLEGYLGDPIHGGNHERLAWRWIDFDPECPTPSGHCGPSKATP